MDDARQVDWSEKISRNSPNTYSKLMWNVKRSRSNMEGKQRHVDTRKRRNPQHFKTDEAKDECKSSKSNIQIRSNTVLSLLHFSFQVSVHSSLDLLYMYRC